VFPARPWQWKNQLLDSNGNAKLISNPRPPGWYATKRIDAQDLDGRLSAVLW
jgi:hypothetical protein